MSDALTDIARDGRISDQIDKIRRKHISGEDYTKELEILETMRRGYFRGSGSDYAKRIGKGTFDWGCIKPHPQRCHKCARCGTLKERGITTCNPPDASPLVKIRLTSEILAHMERFGCASWVERIDEVK